MAMARRLVRPLGGISKRVLLQQQPQPVIFNLTRNYISEMRREAFEENILRLLRYELERSPPSQGLLIRICIGVSYNTLLTMENDEPCQAPWSWVQAVETTSDRNARLLGTSRRRVNCINELCHQSSDLFHTIDRINRLSKPKRECSLTLEIKPITEFDSFLIVERPGEQWIKLNKKFAENEEIRVEVTMFDASVPVKKDSVEIRKVYMRGQKGIVDQPYVGPAFNSTDSLTCLSFSTCELQNSLYDFLETRGINDGLCVFLHQYMKNKDKLEFIRWMEKAKSFIERK
ncbi:hypothetical protein RND71_029529 [Anisodus tanguticus]|uniref:Mitochondrial glycoprotein n=1 Tax=Anisodus tanguticus TaxID=243964 RepID=A0AAE1V4N3_9SOLA|nr:hypothetical protein RND71_029529 [Anisodus tanguticus]